MNNNLPKYIHSFAVLMMMKRVWVVSNNYNFHSITTHSKDVYSDDHSPLGTQMMPTASQVHLIVIL